MNKKFIGGLIALLAGLVSGVAGSLIIAQYLKADLPYSDSGIVEYYFIIGPALAVCGIAAMIVGIWAAVKSSGGADKKENNSDAANGVQTAEYKNTPDTNRKSPLEVTFISYTFCGNCGKRNATGVKFCYNCGEKL